MKEIIIGKNSGFCFGVKNVVDKANNLLKDNKELYCLGEIVHNKSVISDLENKGLVFINELDKKETNVIIRAHGVPKEIYEEAKNKNINLIDLTCPFVLKIHKLVEEYTKQGYFVLVIGKKTHPESIGTYSYCNDNSYMMEDINEIDEFINKFKDSKIKDLFVIVQTTYSEIKFKEIIDTINNKLDNSYNLVIKDTICKTTSNRQKEVDNLSKEVECMIVIGGKNSSNTKELYNIAKRNCNNVISIETYKELEEYNFKGINKIGITAGASTPNSDIKKVKKYIESL